MAYVTNLPANYSGREVARIGRVLTTLTRAEDEKKYIRAMADVTITTVPAGTEFEVVGVFTRIHVGLSRLFAPDYEIVVLKDARGIKSTILQQEIDDYAKINSEVKTK